jgi:hypothetical protein
VIQNRSNQNPILLYQNSGNIFDQFGILFKRENDVDNYLILNSIGIYEVWTGFPFSVDGDWFFISVSG